ncbi:hypothetical protein H6P81_002373 [Aristolochia fimbriata]|uniref:RNA-polymerase II-associated protein 3-like C-terminal domain-containing protein n=1 Tax=Aristolochia fimbriata TaxID=158543 RepID=A0AAV7F9L1_ARIFI|nr:hypothetical protein H6P81_002373 [Aristolochia fimbriata]
MAGDSKRYSRSRDDDFQDMLHGIQNWEHSLMEKNKMSTGQILGEQKAEMRSEDEVPSRRAPSDVAHPSYAVPLKVQGHSRPKSGLLSNIESIGNLSGSLLTEDSVPDANSEKELGNEYFKQKKFKQAIECYSRSIALSPTAVAFANRAMAYLKIKRYEDAESDCTEALNLDDRYVKAYSRRATARKELGKYKLAIEDSEFALRLEPNNQELNKQYSEAKELYAKEIIGKASQPVKSPSPSIQTVKDLSKGNVPDNSFDSNNSQTAKQAAVQAETVKKLPGDHNKHEPKPSVLELASRAASRAMSSSPKDITAPKSAYQFEVSWRRFSDNRALQVDLLKNISPETLPQIFKNALSAPILVDIVKCIATFFLEEMDLAVRFLEFMAQVPRFDMIIMCLSSLDKADLHKIWEDAFSSATVPMELAETLSRLRPKYCPVGLQSHMLDQNTRCFCLSASGFFPPRLRGGILWRERGAKGERVTKRSCFAVQRMGIISRRVLPACGSMCVCCPALRSRSRQPVKRYKKLLADIFPKTVDAPLSDRKITKLGEYAAKNPVRIPKIVKYLEQRTSKELRSDHVKFISIIVEAYNKLLCLCKDQMVFFALSLVNVITEILESTDKDSIRMLACQTLTRFICSQADGTYAHNIENLAPKVCALACESGEGHEKLWLQSSALHCLSAMIWFMSRFSHIFSDFDEIVKVTLDNYGLDVEEDEERGESHHNWVDEVMRCEARGGAGISSDFSPINLPVRPRLEKRDPSMLTREEIETPRVWSQICIQNMVELAKESTTMRRVLDPMLIYFDKGRHWDLRHGLALHVLSDMCYLVEDSGNEQLILAAVIRHLDHKNVGHNPQTKSSIVQIATALTHQLRSQGVVVEIGVVSDLCRHLRKSLQATVELVGQQESNSNIALQKSIEDCLMEIAKGVGDARPLFDMMALTLEKLPAVGVATRAIIGSLLILAHIISLASSTSHSQQIFPEALLMQLLKTMVHPDVETRIGAHWIFAALLVPISDTSRHEGRWQSKTVSTSASVTALLEKLRKEKECISAEMHGHDVHDDQRERDGIEEEWKQGWTRRRSPNFYNTNYYFDRRAGVTCLADEELTIMKFTEDQLVQLLSAFWVQANLPDNLPSNFEAIAHSFSLTFLSSGLKNTNHGMILRFFQLPLSLRNVSLNLSGRLPPSRQRSLYSLATAMLLFAAKSYQILDLIDLLRSSVSYNVDPYLHVADDMQLYYKSQTDLREYGSTADEEAAVSLLSELRIVVREYEKVLLDILIERLSSLTEMEKDDVAKELSVTFIPDDTSLFSPQSVFELDYFQTLLLSKGSNSFDADSPPSPSIEDDVVSEMSAGDLPRFLSKVPISPSLSQILSVGQLLESALEVAGQVAASSISTTPVPYSAMASHCEALGTGTRKKLSTWLGNDSRAEKLLLTFPGSVQSPMKKTNYTLPEESSIEPWSALRLPPASPFDNFLKAAGC